MPFNILTMILSCEQVGNSRPANNRAILILKPRHFQGCSCALTYRSATFPFHTVSCSNCNALRGRLINQKNMLIEIILREILVQFKSIIIDKLGISIILNRGPHIQQGSSSMTKMGTRLVVMVRFRVSMQ